MGGIIFLFALFFVAFFFALGLIIRRITVGTWSLKSPTKIEKLTDQVVLAQIANSARGEEIPAAQLVEDVVEDLRKNPPSQAICYVVLFGDRPLSVIHVNEGNILCFTTKTKAESFMAGYQKTFFCTKPLTALALGQYTELWAMLNNRAYDSLYESPYALIINFNYSGQPYNRYSLDDLKRIGLSGLQKSLSALPR